MMVPPNTGGREIHITLIQLAWAIGRLDCDCGSDFTRFIQLCQPFQHSANRLGTRNQILVESSGTTEQYAHVGIHVGPVLSGPVQGPVICPGG